MVMPAAAAAESGVPAHSWAPDARAFAMKSFQDFLAGLLFVAFGAAALWFGKGYDVGAATRMGPGYLPTVLGWCLVGIGAFIALRAFVLAGEAIPRIHLRPQIMIIAALIAFALLVERVGLLGAAAAVVVLGSLASSEARPREIVVIAALTAVASVALFIYVLGQPMAAWTFSF
jgi:hypothetical protein